jgi:prepilin-type N-terminal cleavage/methylation domain-containing protein
MRRQRDTSIQRLGRTRVAGFTLIELLLALTILLIGLTALWRLQATAIASNANAYRLGLATILAQDGLEQLMGQTYVAGYIDPDLNCAALPNFPAATVDGLETLCPLDGGLRVNGLGNTTVALGPTIFLRSFHSMPLTAGNPNRLLLRVRVTYGNPHTGKRHGVTIGATRLLDSWDPLDRSPDSI